MCCGFTYVKAAAWIYTRRGVEVATVEVKAVTGLYIQYIGDKDEALEKLKQQLKLNMQLRLRHLKVPQVSTG